MEDRQKYRDIPIRGRYCTCDGSSDDGPSFTHWNPTIRSLNPTLSLTQDGASLTDAFRKRVNTKSDTPRKSD